eukprot:m.168753 g.168753  ORF g.168753 m.168753 type:complete len:529 (-) comp16656_c0_seq3:84-1670(-)
MALYHSNRLQRLVGAAIRTDRYHRCRHYTTRIMAEKRSATSSSTAVAHKEQPAPKRSTSGIRPAFKLTRISTVDDRHRERTNSAIFTTTIQELLSFPEQLEASVQFNYMIDLPWLEQQYPASARGKPLLLVLGKLNDLAGIETEADKLRYQQLKVQIALAPNLPPYGTHHTKMMLLFYKQGLRVVVHTANLIHRDWLDKTQGVWVSPLLPRLDPSKDRVQQATGCGPTDTFGHDLYQYVCRYGSSTKMVSVRQRLAAHDFSAVKDRLVASVPGTFKGDRDRHRWGHLRLRRLLEQSAVATPVSTVVLQFSSLGKLDKSGLGPKGWLGGQVRKSMSVSSGPEPELRILFPSKANVRDSNRGWQHGGSIPHSSKYEQLHDFIRGPSVGAQWQADWCGRSRAMPHIKTFVGWSAEPDTIAWCLLGSHNLSKSAWGQVEKGDTQLSIKSYELGVLMVSDPSQPLRPLQLKFGLSGGRYTDQSSRWLPVPYDFPLTPYAKDDELWFWDKPFPGEYDALGLRKVVIDGELQLAS